MANTLFDPVGQFQRGRQGALDIQAREQDLAMQPKRNQLLDLQIGQAQTGAQQQQTKFDQGQALQRATILNQSARALKGLPLEQRESAAIRLAPKLQEFGIDATQFDNTNLTDQVLDSAIAETQGFISDPSRLSAAQREFEAITEGFTPEEKAEAQRIKAGLSPRAVGSGVITTATTPGLTGSVAESEAEIAGAKEGAKLKQQFKLKPEIEAAVTKAVGEAKIVLDRSESQRSNVIAKNLYDTAMGGLVDALSDTATGPFVGFTPALTANAQIAEGAVAAMAPILKQLFRSAGEGVFTDKDQELLLKMIPTRSTLPEARASQLQNIDAIVRAKLNQQGQLPEGVTEDDISTTMQIHGMTREQVLERLRGR